MSNNKTTSAKFLKLQTIMFFERLRSFLFVQAMKRLKEGGFVVAMNPRLRRSTASNMVVEKVLKLAHQCLAPVRQSRPFMKKCE